MDASFVLRLNIFWRDVRYILCKLMKWLLVKNYIVVRLKYILRAEIDGKLKVTLAGHVYWKDMYIEKTCMTFAQSWINVNPRLNLTFCFSFCVSAYLLISITRISAANS
jgi:hypothetical protein